MEAGWENQSMEICREQLGESAYRERLQKNSKDKDGVFTGGKLALSRYRADAKKLITSGTSLYRRYHSVGASGYAVVLKDDRIPPSDFFQPGRRFRVRFRHSNVGLEDDAGSCIREAAVKFADQNEDGPLDLIMHTGRTALARNSRTLVKVLKAKNTTEDLRNLCHTDPYFFYSLVDGLRRCPTSFSNLKYHSQFAYLFKPKGEEEPRIMRFRLVPCNTDSTETEETGLLDHYEQTKPWVTKRRNADNRSHTYLRDEYIQRLHQDEPVKYRIQIQFAPCKEPAPWNPQNIWSEKVSPWIDLIAIRLTTYLPIRALNRTYFNIVEKPQCLEFLPPTSVKDYLSYQKVWCDIYTMCEIKHINQMDRASVSENQISSDASITDFIPYHVTVCSAALKESGIPKVDLYLTLIGTESRTTPVHLEKRVEMKEKRKKGTTDSIDTTPSEHLNEELFEIEAERVGVLLAIVLAVRHRQLTDDWYLKFVIVADPEGKKSRFPCHNVVNSDVVLRTGDVCLRQKEQFEVHRQERLFELCERRHRYSWANPQRVNAGTSLWSATSSPEIIHNLSLSTEENLSLQVASTSSASDSISAAGRSGSVSRATPVSGGLPCGHIKARSVDQLPSTERMHAVKFTGLRWEVDIKLVEFFRTLHFANNTTGAKIRSKAWIKETTELKPPVMQAIGTVRKFSTMRQFSLLPKDADQQEEKKANRAMARWKQVRHAIQFICEAKIPDGSKGEMCQMVRSDINFGRLFLAGPHPLMIKRCQALPSNFPVTQLTVDGLLERSRKLSDEMRNGHVYIADYAALQDIQTIHKDADHRYMVAPLVLFYVRTSGDLVPLAIQLQQIPGPSNPIWTCKDRSEIWILVKLWVRCADFQIHFAVSHLFKCHTLMEPFVVATMRQLPAPHPVYKLLKRHFRCFLVSNTQVRCNILRKGSPVEKFTSLGVKGFKSLVQKYLGQFTFDEMFPMRDFEARGVADERKLPNYYYRDDAKKLWTAMRTYVRDILGLYYNDDDDLQNDEEIQCWIKGIHDFGFPHFDERQRQGLPRTFTSLDELAEVVTMVMFTLTCSHSATHSDALDLYGFLPDAPALMRQPPPSDRNKDVTREDFTALLPDQFPDAYYGSLALAMLVYKPDENVLAHSTEGYFTEPKAVVVVERFRATIKQINVTIRARNAINKYLYENLLPEAIPLSAEPIPYVPRKALDKALILGPEMTRELMFGGQSANGIRTTIPCMALPVCVQFANTLGGRSFIARRPGGFDTINRAEEESRGDVTDGGGATTSSSSKVGRSFSSVAEHATQQKSEEKSLPVRSRLLSSAV